MLLEVDLESLLVCGAMQHWPAITNAPYHWPMRCGNQRSRLTCEAARSSSAATYTLKGVDTSGTNIPLVLMKSARAENFSFKWTHAPAANADFISTSGMFVPDVSTPFKVYVTAELLRAASQVNRDLWFPQHIGQW